MIRALSIYVACVLVAVLPVVTYAETPLKDPLIPHGETALYRVQEGDNEWRFTEEILVASEEGKNIYAITYQSDTETTEVKIQKSGMIPISVFTVTKKDGMTFESSTRVSLTSEIDADTIVVLSFSDLKYSLRGFPFENGKTDLGISFLSANDDDDNQLSFEIKVSYLKIDAMVIDGRTIDCHKLELKMRASGLMRVMNTFIPKTYFWYSTEAPHYLVAYEGSSGFPGSQKRYIEIADYSGWK